MQKTGACALDGGEMAKWNLFRMAAVVLFLVTISPAPARAEYNANMTGVVRYVAVYADGDYLYFRLENQPTSHPVCNPAYFVVSQDIPQNRRNQMLAALLAARYSGEPINIGYDNSIECMHGYIRVHEVG